MELSDILINLSILFTVLTIYFHLKIFNFWRSRGVPGPMPWPIFGTSVYYLFSNKIDLETKWKNTYGKTYGIFEGYTATLRTTDADLIKDYNIKQFQNFTDRHTKYIHQVNQQRWMLWSHGDHWANQRALMTPMFTAKKMRNVLSTMSDCVERFISEVERRNSLISGQQFEAEDLKSTIVANNMVVGEKEGEKRLAFFNKFDMSGLTLDVIASSFFGLKLDTYKVSGPQEEFIKRAYGFADFDVSRFFAWLLLPTPLAALFRFDLFGPMKYKYFDDLSQKIIKERRQSKGPKRNDVIQALIDAELTDGKEKVFSELDDKEAHYSASMSVKQMELQQQRQVKEAKLFKKFDDDEIRGQMTFLFVAGFETTASTLSFALHELAHQPKAQAKILDELKEAFGQQGELLQKDDFEQENSYNKLLEMKLLDAFISEVLRIYSPIIDHNRSVTNERGAFLEINGKQVHLPYKTPIATNSLIVHRDPDYFERPNEFDASRFFPENKDKIKTGSFMPFGIGPRHCLGMRFGLLEVKLAIAKLLLRYNVYPHIAGQYPPAFKQNAAFLQFENTNFILIPREH